MQKIGGKKSKIDKVMRFFEKFWLNPKKLMCTKLLSIWPKIYIYGLVFCTHPNFHSIKGF